MPTEPLNRLRAAESPPPLVDGIEQGTWLPVDERLFFDDLQENVDGAKDQQVSRTSSLTSRE